MIWIVRIVAAVLVVFGVLGLFATWLSQGQQFTMPMWNGEAWTAQARRAADWAVFGGFVVAGSLVILRSRGAGLVFALVIALAVAKAAYDLAFGDHETTRYAVIFRGDIIAVAVAIVGVLIAWVAPRREAGAGSGSGSAPTEH